jgi:hypothetical protein
MKSTNFTNKKMLYESNSPHNIFMQNIGNLIFSKRINLVYNRKNQFLPINNTNDINEKLMSRSKSVHKRSYSPFSISKYFIY